MLLCLIDPKVLPLPERFSSNFCQRFHIQTLKKWAAAVWHHAVIENKLNNFHGFCTMETAAI
jgi:hypothetical protein